MLCATQPSRKEAELALAGEGGGLRGVRSTRMAKCMRGSGSWVREGCKT